MTTGRRAQRASIALSFLVALSLAGCGQDAPPAERAAAQPVEITSVSVRRISVDRFHEVSGTVRGRATAVISSKLPAYVATVAVDAGDRVDRGQVLITLDAGEVSSDARRTAAAVSGGAAAVEVALNGLVAAEADLELAAATRERYRMLIEKRAVTPHELDEVEARWVAARAARDAASAQLRQAESGNVQAREGYAAARVMEGYTKLTAPFAGRVLERRVDPGTLATPGAPLLLLSAAGAARVEIAVEESLIGAIAIGSRATVAIASVELEAAARIVELEPQIDPGSRAYRAELELELDETALKHRLRPGQFARVRLPVGTTERLLIPSAAVRRRGQLDRVLVLEAGEVRMRLVTLGDAYGNRREVLSGLEPGEAVVSPWRAGLRDGMRAAR